MTNKPLPVHFRIILAIITVLKLSVMPVSGQKIIRSTLGSIGAGYTVEGFVFRETSGQPSATSVLRGKELVLRQGFQQPLSKSISEEKGNKLEFKLFPNPTETAAWLEIPEDIMSYKLTITNINGIIMETLMIQNHGLLLLDLDALGPGIYLVTIDNGKRKGTTRLVVTP